MLLYINILFYNSFYKEVYWDVREAMASLNRYGKEFNLNELNYWLSAWNIHYFVFPITI